MSTALLAAKKGQQHGVLDMQPVFGLVHDEGGGAIHHLRGDLQLPMSRLAMQHMLDAGAVEQGLIDLVRHKEVFDLLHRGVVAHGDPGICVGHVEPFDISHVIADVDGRPRLGRQCLRLQEDLGIRAVAFRADQGDVGAEGGPQQQQRVADVVAITEVGKLHLRQVVVVLGNGHKVGQPLTGVVEVAQAVHHRHCAVLRQLDQGLVIEHPGDDGITPARQVGSEILHRLPLAQRAVLLIQIDAVATQFGDTDVEGDPGAQGGLLEQGNHTLAGQRLAVLLWVGLYCFAQRNQRFNLGFVQITVFQKMLHRIFLVPVRIRGLPDCHRQS
ncbi:hypothetical protein AERO8C_50347 [Aeromonas veronii]|uniref:Uncharacterized protein n=1 Tax=Aeromonas veronii TaxID=654 RepID=A0A653L7W3_AERVE|nr:hypothetical protein AERO8C_50347 [Aeromonas veronii]